MAKTSFILGPICVRGHNHEGTGQSLRYSKSPGTCVECKKLQRQKWKSENPDRYKQLAKNWNDKNKEHHRIWKSQYRITHPDKKIADTFKRICGRKKRLCRNKKIPFNLTEEYLKNLWQSQTGMCYWLKVPMELDAAQYHPLKATIDRLESCKGYVEGNVVWSTSFANLGRVNTPAAEFAAMLPKLLTGFKG